jgi:hypothetical protein
MMSLEKATIRTASCHARQLSVTTGAVVTHEMRQNLCPHSTPRILLSRTILLVRDQENFCLFQNRENCNFSKRSEPGESPLRIYGKKKDYPALNPAG